MSRDFNSILGNSCIYGIKQRYIESTENDNGHLMVAFPGINNKRVNKTFLGNPRNTEGNTIEKGSLSSNMY